jgi:hypothetical protein
VGLDPHKGLTEVDEHRNVEDLVGVEVQVLDTVVLEEAFEEVARRESQPALDEPRKHWDLVGTLLHWIWISRSGAPHVHFLLAEETAVHQHQQVFGLCLGSRSAVLTLGRIQPPRHKISFSRHQSSCSSMENPSSSKCTGFSLAFARGLLWRQAVAARVDLWPKARRQCARMAKSWIYLFQRTANAKDGKP